MVVTVACFSDCACEPEALFERLDGQTRHCEIEMGDGVQRCVVLTYFLFFFFFSFSSSHTKRRSSKVIKHCTTVAVLESIYCSLNPNNVKMRFIVLYQLPWSYEHTI